MKVAIRDDDTSYFTKPKDLQRAYDFLNEDDCVSLSVVPYTVPVHRDDVFPYGKEIGMGYYDIAENTELLEYLKEKYKQGKVDILLHGYSHEYQLSENKWLAEMKWKSSSQLKEEIPKGKKHLEKLLGMNISVFVAPNNSIDKKAISVLEDLQMNYSGIIGVRDIYIIL